MKAKTDGGPKDKHAKKQANYRLSDDSVDVLNKVATKLKCSKTHIIEQCIAKHALELVPLDQEARAAVYKILSQPTSSVPPAKAELKKQEEELIDNVRVNTLASGGQKRNEVSKPSETDDLGPLGNRG